MLRLLAYLNKARAEIESLLEQNSLDMLAAFNGLNTELQKFESALPKFGAKDINALMKSMSRSARAPPVSVMRPRTAVPI